MTGIDGSQKTTQGRKATVKGHWMSQCQGETELKGKAKGREKQNGGKGVVERAEREK